jgi:hypothetical protein
MTRILEKRNGRPGKSSIPRRPALGLSVAQPNPSVANSLGSLRKRVSQIVHGRIGVARRQTGPKNVAAAVTVALLRFTKSIKNCRGFMILNYFVRTITAPRYKQMTTSKKMMTFRWRSRELDSRLEQRCGKMPS